MNSTAKLWVVFCAVWALQIPSAASAQPRAEALIQEAQAREDALKNDPQKLRFRHHLEALAARWARARRAAERPKLQRQAAEGELRALSLLAHWSGAPSDRAAAEAAARALRSGRTSPERRESAGEGLKVTASSEEGLSFSFSPVPEKIHSGTVPKRSGRGARLYFDIPLEAARGARGGIETGEPRVKRVRLGSNKPGVSRLVVELQPEVSLEDVSVRYARGKLNIQILSQAARAVLSGETVKLPASAAPASVQGGHAKPVPARGAASAPELRARSRLASTPKSASAPDPDRRAPLRRAGLTPEIPRRVRGRAVEQTPEIPRRSGGLAVAARPADPRPKLQGAGRSDRPELARRAEQTAKTLSPRSGRPAVVRLAEKTPTSIRPQGSADRKAPRLAQETPEIPARRSPGLARRAAPAAELKPGRVAPRAPGAGRPRAVAEKTPPRRRTPAAVARVPSQSTRMSHKGTVGTAPAQVAKQARRAPADEQLNRRLRRSTRRALAPRDHLAVEKVVIDAGHGGKEEGAVAGGVREKDVNLAVAKKLGALLKEQGVEVIYTRTRDVDVSLERRAKIANRSGADLFISVHANANRDNKVHGVETYYLDTGSRRYNRRLANRERSLPEARPESDRQGRDLQLILADLAMRSASAQSRRVAGHIQREIIRQLLPGHSGVKDLGVKKALFYVLLGARMPAVLVETGFVTHQAERRQLASAAYQQELAEGIARGVAAYIGERRRVAARQGGDGGSLAELSGAQAAP